MNTTKAHQGIADVYAAIAACHAQCASQGTQDDAARMPAATAALRTSIDSLTATADEPINGAAELKLSRQAGNAITAGEASLAYLTKR